MSGRHAGRPLRIWRWAGTQAGPHGWRKGVMDYLWVIGFLVVWFLLQAVILPRLGVPT